MNATKYWLKLGGILGIVLAPIVIGIASLTTIDNRIHTERYEKVSPHISRSKSNTCLEFRVQNIIAHDYEGDGKLDSQTSHYPFRLVGIVRCTPNHPAWNNQIELAYSEEFKTLNKTHLK